MELTNKDIEAYEKLSTEQLIEELTRLARGINDMSISVGERNYLMDSMEVVWVLIWKRWERMYG